VKRTRRTLSAAERLQATAFKESVQGRPCIRCGRVWPEMDAHHGIDASFLRRNRSDHVYDPRNACPICPRWEPCHGDHTSAMRRIPRSCLPASVEEFATELGLESRLERTYPKEGNR
jgi:hypothetical protein